MGRQLNPQRRNGSGLGDHLGGLRGPGTAVLGDKESASGKNLIGYPGGPRLGSTEIRQVKCSPVETDQEDGRHLAQPAAWRDCIL